MLWCIKRSATSAAPSPSVLLQVLILPAPLPPHSSSFFTKPVPTEGLGPTSTPSSFIAGPYVLGQTTGLSTVWLQEQCFQQHAALQPGQGAGEVLQDQLRLQRLRRQQQPPGVRQTGHRTQGPRPEGHLPQRIRRCALMSLPSFLLHTIRVARPAASRKSI